ncbi:MAG: hypothetical protein J6U52_05800, partial [Alistipes sp.]|nr:hypothetical protein [Alistipes sp.]
YVMSKFTIPDKLDSYAESKILIYNSGFVYCVATSSGAYHNYWHCYDIHKDGEFGTEAWVHKHEDIRMINDRFLISRSASGGYIVYVRNSMDLTDIPSQVPLSQGYEVVDINGAMVLTRGSSGAAIYDFRSTSSSRYYLLNIGADGKAMTLCGDIVAAVNVTPLVSIQWKRVIPRLSDLITVNTVDNGRE